jgi:hypothetical protein
MIGRASRHRIDQEFLDGTLADQRVGNGASD